MARASGSRRAGACPRQRHAKVQSAIVHDVCEVHSTEARDQLDIDDRAAYASILKELQRSLDAKDDPDVATQTFCELGRGLQKP